MEKNSTVELAVRSTFLALGLALGLVLGAAGCAVDSGGAEGGGELGDAEAAIEATGAVAIVGEADFEEEEDGTVSAEVAVESAPPGTHGVHIHEIGDCGNGGMDAGDHWNPEGSEHGMPGSGHLGDLGNMEVGEDGVGTLEMSSADWSVGDGSETDLMGLALIVHAGADDFGQPLGNAGERIGCGVIVVDPD